MLCFHEDQFMKENTSFWVEKRRRYIFMLDFLCDVMYRHKPYSFVTNIIYNVAFCADIATECKRKTSAEQ